MKIIYHQNQINSVLEADTKEETVGHYRDPEIAHASLEGPGLARQSGPSTQ